MLAGQGGLQTETALFGVEAVFGEFVLATKEGVVLVGVELAEQFGLGGEVDGGEGAEQVVGALAQEGDDGLGGGVGAQGEGVGDLGLLAVVGKGEVDLAEDVVEEVAVVVEFDPLLEAFEGAVIGAQVEEAVAAEVFDDQVVANLVLHLAQGEIEQVFGDQGPQQLGGGMGGMGARPAVVVIPGDDCLQRLPVQHAFHLEQELILPQHLAVNQVGQPQQQLGEVAQNCQTDRNG